MLTSVAAYSSLGAAPSLVLADGGAFLMSIWKPVLLVIPFIGWGWIVAHVYDKHALRFHLGREKWNMIHMTAGLLALAAALLIPIEAYWGFFVSFLVVVAILAADIIAFPLIANKDERVPERAHLRLDFSSLAEARAKKAEAKQAGTVALAINRPDKTKVPVPEKETEEYEVRVAAEALVIRAVDMGATRVDLAPTGKDNTYAASYLVDGVRHAGETLSANQAVRVHDFWKSAGKLDVSDRRRRMKADLSFDHSGVPHTLRVETMGAQGGVRLTLRLDLSQQVRRAADELGLLPQQMDELRALVQDGQGVVLLAAPPGQGRTTTLYSVVQMHDAYTSNVQTIEVDMLDSLEGVRQNVFDQTADGQEYSKLVRSILRRDPDVVGIAELPDSETAQEITRSDHDRTRVYVTVRADSVLGAVQVWAKAVGDLEQASSCLRGVVAEKLMRNLCMNCRVPYQPSPDMLKKLGLPADKVKQLFKKGGQVLIKNKPDVCPVCQGVGYKGQTGAFELCRFTDEDRAKVKSNDLNGLRAELRKRQVVTVQQAALRKAVEGVTSVEEVLRVTAEPQKKPAQGRGKAESGGGEGAERPTASAAGA